MHQEATSSLNVGLEESVYLGEILQLDVPVSKATSGRSFLRNFLLDNHREIIQTKSKMEDETFCLNGLEIYWPYSDNWDGQTQPVIVLGTNEENMYFDGDCTHAYRYINPDEFEQLVVNEEYAKNNPVWVINNSDVSLDDIINLKNGNFEKTCIIPRDISTLESKTTLSDSEYNSRLTIESIQSTVQHDKWGAGGSEYVISWIYPNVTNVKNTPLYNKHGQIKLSRKEIENKVIRTINFIGNYDWHEDYIYNKIQVLEYDGGGEKPFNVSLKINLGNIKFESSVEIPHDKKHDEIMESHIDRSAYFEFGNDAPDDKDGNPQRSLEITSYGVTIKTLLTKRIMDITPNW